MTRCSQAFGIGFSLLAVVLVGRVGAGDREATIGTRPSDGGCVTFMDPDGKPVKIKKREFLTLHVVNRCATPSTIAVARSHEVHFAKSCRSVGELELTFGTYTRFARQGQPKDSGRFICQVPSDEPNTKYFFTVTEGGTMMAGHRDPILTHVLDIQIEP